MFKKMLLMSLALLSLLVLAGQAPTALAQGADPPGDNDAAPGLPGPLAKGPPSLEDHLQALSTPGISPETGLLSIADSNDFENDSDVVYGYSEYGIAYEREKEIWVAFYRYDGQFLNRYQLSDGQGKSTSPAIAFEGSFNLYVVAWQYNFLNDNTDFDVYGRAVSALTGPQGEKLSVASTTLHETDPDLDCNHDDSSCLVAFTFDDAADIWIKGRFIDVTSAGLTAPPHAAFDISDVKNQERPYVAWGQGAGRYMVVYHQPGGAGDAEVVYSHVYDTYQAAGDQYIFGSTYLINVPDLENDTFVTGITHDPVSEKFLTLVTHDWAGDGSDYDILLQVNSDSAKLQYSPLIDIAVSEVNETMGSISFLTNPWAAQFDPGPDKVAIAYHREGQPASIRATVITGNSSTTAPAYRVPKLSEHALVREDPGAWGSFITQPAVAGADGSGRFMVTLTTHFGGTVHDEDIQGVILRTDSNQVFVPLIVK